MVPAPVTWESDLDQRPAALPPRLGLVHLGCGGDVLFVFGLQLGGHGHAEVGVVDEAVSEHEVDADDGGQHVDLADEYEGQSQKTGQNDGCHWSPVWASLEERVHVKTKKRAQVPLLIQRGPISSLSQKENKNI